jgi:hypothetical protein
LADTEAHSVSWVRAGGHATCAASVARCRHVDSDVNEGGSDTSDDALTGSCTLR